MSEQKRLTICDELFRMIEKNGAFCSMNKRRSMSGAKIVPFSLAQKTPCLDCPNRYLLWFSVRFFWGFKASLDLIVIQLNSLSIIGNSFWAWRLAFMIAAYYWNADISLTFQGFSKCLFNQVQAFRCSRGICQTLGFVRRYDPPAAAISANDHSVLYALKYDDF